MNRREAIERVAWIMGGTVIGAEFFLSGCKPKETTTGSLFDTDHVAYMNEIADTILPETSTPGAKAANVGEFMGVMVRDCYAPDDQKVFNKGLDQLNEACDKKYGKKFMELDGQQRIEILNQLNKEQIAYTKTKKPDAPNHYFRMLKELTLLGYFTSEVGATKALRYDPVPGKYIGDYPYKKGDKAWALS